jgi:hypothetical protein
MLGFSGVSEYSISEVPEAPATLPDYSGIGIPPAYPIPPPDLPDERHHRIMIARSTALAMSGKTNNVVQQLTLSASTTVTQYAHPLIGFNSALLFMPLTSNARDRGVWVSNQLVGSCTLNHTSDAATDATFRVVIIG